MEPKLKTNLFQMGRVALASGHESDFKIECDALTDDDIECLAYLISKRAGFRQVHGVPTGGLRLQNALKKYIDSDPLLPVLIVDDVYTTGKSMARYAGNFYPEPYIGFVIFARGELPEHVQALFKM